MDPMITTLVITGAALVLFILELIPAEMTALAAAAALVLTGVLSPGDGFSGFSNDGTITVLFMFILAAGVQRTGIVNVVAHRVLAWAGGSPRKFLAILILFTGAVSGFVNNTPLVAIMMPLVITVATRLRRSPSKYLIPLSYATMLGGTITLIGTSTNVVASGIAKDLGYEGFSMFMFAPVGIVVFLVGALYLVLIGWHLLPERHRAEAHAERFGLRDYVCEVVIRPGSRLIGQTVEASDLKRLFDIDIIRIFRGEQVFDQPLLGIELHEADILLIRAPRQELLHIRQTEGIDLLADVTHALPGAGGDDMALAEAIIAPGSPIEGQTLKDARFLQTYDAAVLAVKKRERLFLRRFESIRLQPGDTLLVAASSPTLDALKTKPEFIISEELGEEKFRRNKLPLVLLIMATVIGAAALGYTPISVAAMAGVVLMVVTGCLRINEVHDAIRWDVVLLIAGVVPLGIALQKTGAAALLAEWIAGLGGDFPALGILAVVYIVTMLLTQMMSNVAAAVLMIPIAANLGETLGLNPITLMLGVMFAASSEFMTPIGYQTNLMIYGPGEYRFTDYTKVGAPLNLIVMVVTVLLLDQFFPLSP